MEKSTKNKSLIIVISLLIVIIFVLAIFMAVIITKYDNLEDKYEDRYEERYNENDTTINNSKTEEDYISKDKALEIVLNDLKITKNDIYDLDIEYENKNRYDGVVIEINFDYDGFEYEYYLDVKNGNILDSFKSRD